MSPRAACAALVWMCALAACRGHGIATERAEGGIGIVAFYDNGEPVSFAEARLFAPGPEDRPALVSTTDRNGYFMFRPHTQGTWKVTVDDGMGHVTTAFLPFQGTVDAASRRDTGRMPRRYGAVAGLGLLFGIFGWSAFLRSRRAAPTEG